MDILNKVLSAKCNCLDKYYDEDTVRKDMVMSCQSLVDTIVIRNLHYIDDDGAVIHELANMLISVQMYLCISGIEDLESIISQNIDKELEHVREDFACKIAKDKSSRAKVDEAEKALKAIEQTTAADATDGKGVDTDVMTEEEADAMRDYITSALKDSIGDEDGCYDD